MNQPPLLVCGGIAAGNRGKMSERAPREAAKISGRNQRLPSVGYATQFAQSLRAEAVRCRPRCRADSAIGPQAALAPRESLRKVGLEAGEFRPGLLRLAGTGALAGRGCLYEIVYET